jgi:hypothetical protein
MAAAANASTISIEPHLGRRELMLWVISRFRIRDAPISVCYSKQKSMSSNCGTKSLIGD